MESISKKHFFRKEELVDSQDVNEWPKTHSTESSTESVIDRNVEKHLYGNIQFCEVGEVFEAGDYC
jgi:hypothetical protein